MFVWLTIIGLFFSYCQNENSTKKDIKITEKIGISITDSLTQLLSKNFKEDTNRVNWLNDLAWEIMFDDATAGREKINEALSISQKISYKKGEADALNRLAILSENDNKFIEASKFYYQVLSIREAIGDKKGVASIHTNLGNLYEALEKFDTALYHFTQCVNLSEELKDSVKAFRAHYNIGLVHEELGNYDEASQHINQYRFFVENNKDSVGMALSYRMLGHIRMELDQYNVALDWYKKSLILRKKLADTTEIAKAITDLANALDEKKPPATDSSIQLYFKAIDLYKKTADKEGEANALNGLGDALKHQNDYKRAINYLSEAVIINKEIENYSGLMEVYNTLGDVYFNQKNLAKAKQYLDFYFALAETTNDKKYIQKGYKDYAKFYSATGQWQTAFDYRVKYDDYRYTQLDERRAKDFERKEALFSDQKVRLDNDKKTREIEKQDADLAKKESQIAKDRATRNALLGGAAFLTLLIVFLYNRNRLRAKANRDLAQKNIAIEAERARADGLLKNILPASTAEELKKNNFVRPEKYESVTVMFTDFKSFTTIAETMPPEELVAELDECFRFFDAVVEKYGVEKIKTIGDAYMCVGGLPVPNGTHAFDVVSAALEMQDGLKKLTEKKRAAGQPFFEMRIGIHTGPVVAGVVGAKKFAYDIWGDTVNTAARMESGSEPGKVNISETTFRVVKDKFHCIFRGKMPAKNKGEIAMYFVESEDFG